MSAILVPPSARERLARLRELERLVASPIDPDLEAWRASRYRYASDQGLVVRVRRIRGGSFTTGTQAEAIYANQNVGTAKNTFTTEAVINDTAGMGPQPVLLPYFWQASPNLSIGRAVRIVARGIISTTLTPTFQWFARLGGAASTAGPNIGSSAALTTGSGISSQLWEFELDVQMVTPGATGGNSTVRGEGMLFSPGGLASPFGGALFGGGATPGTVATVDLSTTNYLNLDAACGTSSASNGITVHQLLLLGLN